MKECHKELIPIPFFFKGYEVRAIRKQDNEIWFVAKDVAGALGRTWDGHVLDNIPNSWKGVVSFTTPGGEQKIIVINEPALYKLSFRSNKPEANDFTNWVASEVLPAIRKTGNYSVHQSGPVSSEMVTDETIRQSSVARSFDLIRPKITETISEATMDAFRMICPMIAEAVRQTAEKKFAELARNIMMMREDRFQAHIAVERLNNNISDLRADVNALKARADLPDDCGDTEPSNPESGFVERMCRLSPDIKTPKEELYAAYTAYCKRHGFHAVFRNYFFRRLYEISDTLRSSAETVRGTRIPTVKGIALKKR